MWPGNCPPGQISIPTQSLDAGLELRRRSGDPPPIVNTRSHRSRPALLLVATLLWLVAEPARAGVESVEWGAYLDLAYLHSSTKPSNRTWRSKGTSNELDRGRLNNATIWIRKDATSEQRWGFELGVQTGVDPDSGIPPAEVAVDGADALGYLYSTNLSYLFPVGRGLRLTGGLLPGFPGYAGFHSIDNPSYTRPYVGDFVPYFLWGLRADYPVDARLTGSFYLVSGWNYLESPNDAPSYGARGDWQATDRLHFSQSLYYGPEQGDTALEFWRFMTDTTAEYVRGPILVAAGFTWGSEKQAAVSARPRHDWFGAALWLQWRASEHWRLTVRPELFDDSDGLQTSARQTITALTTTLEYRYSRAPGNELSLRAELRWDRSTGEDGGFYEGPANRLVRDQDLAILALLWSFDSSK
jgi:hypothetical protein